MAPETLSLAGKTAIVTGSGKENGLGAGMAKAFAQNGANVAIHHVSEASKSRAEETAKHIASEYGVKTTVVQGDISDPEQCKGIVTQALEGLGAEHINILVNNSADGSAQAPLAITPEHLNSMFAVNVFGPVYMIQAVVNEGRMPHGGRIINVSSIASKMGMNFVSTYAAAKAATDSFTAAWASELGFSHGITVNTLAPGPIPTETSAPYLVAKDGGATDMQAAMVAKTRAEARLGTIQDFADAALLLVQEKSRWITAQYISVSGGITGWM